MGVWARFAPGVSWPSRSEYPSKQDHGKVVPTWNYEVAHVGGKLTWRDDPAWLREQLAKLTARFEDGRPEPWAMSDAPEDYLSRQIAGVIGVELDVREVRVKRKLSQNRAVRDRDGVIAGLRDSSVPADQLLAAVMEERSAGLGRG
jgi:transcriptional regulator